MKLTDLKPGMLIHEGLFIRAYKKGESKIAPEGCAICFLDIEDSYYGQTLRSVQADAEFELLYETGSVQYHATLKRLLAEQIDMLTAAENNTDLIVAYMNQ